MLTDAERTQLRADIEATLPDRCDITRPSKDKRVLDPVTLELSDPFEITVSEDVPCRVAPTPGPRVVQVGEQPVSLKTYEVTLPVSIDDLEVNDVLTITKSADPALVARRLRVTDVRLNSLGVQRRSTCEGAV